MADILQIVIVLVYFAENTGHRPIHNELIEFFDLSMNIKDVVLSILVIDTPHNHFEFINILVIDTVAFGSALFIDPTAYGFLEDGGVTGREESEGDFRRVEIPPEHVGNEVGFRGFEVIETGYGGFFGRKSGSNGASRAGHRRGEVDTAILTPLRVFRVRELEVRWIT